MNKIGSILLLSLSLLSCSVNPEPLVLGKDACYTCKMTLMDKNFGAEIVTKKGKVYKFDDLNCMLKFIGTGNEMAENIALQLVVDFAQPEKLINTQHAFYCLSEQIRSPMASHLAGFENKEDLERYNKEWSGIILTWEELLKQSN